MGAQKMDKNTVGEKKGNVNMQYIPIHKLPWNNMTLYIFGSELQLIINDIKKRKYELNS